MTDWAAFFYHAEGYIDRVLALAERYVAVQEKKYAINSGEVHFDPPPTDPLLVGLVEEEGKQ